MKETLIFLKEFLLNQGQIGGVRPSSKALSKMIAATITNEKSPKRVLEIGPGTGNITEEILKNLGKEDFLTLVEINPVFFKILQKKKEDWIKNGNCPHIEILNLDFLKHNPSNEFDVVIAGVPFNNFPPEIILAFINKIKSILKSGGIFAYFEYLGARKIKEFFGDKETSFYLKEIYPFLIDEKKVLKNLPPAKINILSFN
jgi:phosphatidylethanolamine/phosphatidyl-N-methylethanolamine N-methyltransferase